jgi:hypothetical protein
MDQYRYTVWSPFDGGPIPVPNDVERDLLLAQGYLPAPPESESDTPTEPPAEPVTPIEPVDAEAAKEPKGARRDRRSVRTDSPGVPPTEDA